MSASRRIRFGIFGVVVIAAVVGVVIAFGRGKSVPVGTIATTVGDLRSMHAAVLVRKKEARGNVRLTDGDDISTGPDGRARVRLDDGTLIVIDGATDLKLEGSRVTLSRGRLFVQAGASSRTEVAFGGASTTLVSSAAAFELADKTGNGNVYCARGELTVTANGKQAHVASGETASLQSGAVTVAPETAFDDWTGGLAVPWSGERGPQSAIAELWGGGGGADPGAPLVVRAENVDVEIDGELAITRMKTSYFNGSDSSVEADVRMALPKGAIVSRVARLNEGQPTPYEASVAPGTRNGMSSGVARLEWAGGGWLRGSMVGIGPGMSVDLLVDYVEWLPERDGRATYRFPMASEILSPMVGGLSVRVKSKGNTRILSASTGALALDDAIELHRADIRPTADLTIEMAPTVVHENAARAYVEPGGKDEDPYVLVRTEAPSLAESGVTLALVVDTSMSVGPSLLETERATVDAVLDAMGPKDSVVVLAADQSARVVGPEKPTFVTPEARAQIRKALAQIHAGGASNLGVALERAADLLDAQDADHAGLGMVVYLGDGRPTVGETTARDLQKRLARRPTGAPRLGAIAIGQAADRWMLAELIAGAGPIYDVLDRPDAARAGAALVADAITPTLREIAIDLGPTVDRVYPRDARTAAAGTTITVAGRLRGALPDSVGFRYRKGTKLVEERRSLTLVNSPMGADVAKRWAEERIEEMAVRGDGIEPAIALATKAKILTPWTSWFWGSDARSMPWDDRILGLSPDVDTPFASHVQPAPQPPSLLIEPPKVFDGEASIEDAAEIAARHAILDSYPALIACRDARAAVRPGVSGNLRVDVSVNADGHATKVNVVSENDGEDDAVLDRCARVVINAVPFFGAGVSITFTEVVTLPAGLTLRRTECSVASTLPLSVRRGIWRARKAKGALDYLGAAHACELPTWSDRRTLLGIWVSNTSVNEGAAIARNLSSAGEVDAAAFVKEELLRRTNLSALAYDDLRALIIGDEPKIDRVLDKVYRAAKTDDERMRVLRRFLRLAPHSPLGRRLMLSLLESTNQKDALAVEIDHIRTDSFADAGLLAWCASALRRLGHDEEGRRAFGELVERAPRDPWTLAYVGDRLRAEGLYEEALATYKRLDESMPDDPAVALRLALAHAGAGRLDVATRLLDRAAQSGGRGDDGRLGELSSIVSASLLATARKASPNAETDALLVRRLAQTPLPDVQSLILVRTLLADDEVDVSVARQETDRDELPADLDAAAMGLAAVRIERGGGTARIHIRRAHGIPGNRATHGTVTALVLAADRSNTKLVTRDIDIAPGEQGVVLRWNGETLQ